MKNKESEREDWVIELTEQQDSRRHLFLISSRIRRRTRLVSRVPRGWPVDGNGIWKQKTRMVSFSCNACADTIKKPKAVQHMQSCRSTVACIDCGTTFDQKTIAEHTSCVSEGSPLTVVARQPDPPFFFAAEKYQKSLYKGPKAGEKAAVEVDLSQIRGPPWVCEMWCVTSFHAFLLSLWVFECGYVFHVFFFFLSLGSLHGCYVETPPHPQRHKMHSKRESCGSLPVEEACEQGKEIVRGERNPSL